MIWKKISVETTIHAVDLLSEFLSEQGVEGIMIEDSQPLSEDEIKEMFVDIPLMPDKVDENAVVSFFLDSSYNDTEIDRLAESIRTELKRLSEFIPVGSGNIDMSETSDDTTWNDNFKNYFKPMRLYDNLVIFPVWELDNPEQDFICNEDDKIIKIESVMAFGTGTHETTRLCLGMLKKYMKDMSSVCDNISVFDVGCGSGILSIAASYLGADFVHGLDIDPQAVEASKINAAANELGEDKVLFSCGNLLAGNMIAENYMADREAVEKASLGSGVSSVMTPEEAARMVDIENGQADPVEKRKYDIIVANILADVIIPLSSVVSEYMKDGGIFICSGISDTKVDSVKIALMQNGFNIIDIQQENEWFAIASVR